MEKKEKNDPEWRAGGDFDWKETEKCRIWKRQWRYQSLERPFEIFLPFEIKPAAWPDIEIVCVPKGQFRRETNRYEVELVVDAGCAQQIECSILGEHVIWDAVSNMLTVGEEEPVFLEHRDGVILIHMHLDEKEFKVRLGKESFCGKRTREQKETQESKERIFVAARSGLAGSFEGCGNGCLICLTVYGLRASTYSKEVEAEIERRLPMGKGMDRGGEMVYQSANYCIRENRLSDRAYGKPDAYVFDAYTICSPPRVTEEFEWRHTPMGDMTRILNHESVWRGKPQTRFPEITTGIPSIDAAYHVALDVLTDACSSKFALPGEEGMWSAGAFQGKGMGFGVWRRDTMQIFLRGGVLWEPKVSRKTLQYIMKSGKDNAVDGIAAPVISCWEYYLATHDVETVRGMWPHIQEQMREAESYFDMERGLMRAAYNSANDAFADTEADGYALSTEIYFMEAYRAAAKFAELFAATEEKTQSEAVQSGEMQSKGRHSHAVSFDAIPYEKRYRTLLKTIREQYWNPEYQYYTSGPIGSRGFLEGTWESCGQEAAILERFGVAAKTQKKQILKALEKKILTEYGIPLMPGHREKSHVTHAAWPVYYTGYARCAGENGNRPLLMKLIAQQVRSAVFQKTFYEVLDVDTGRNWRWPGQTWHAMGYISMLLYGVLGLKLEERGISFKPCIPKELRGIRVENLRYCQMTLAVYTRETRGHSEMLLDDAPCEWIPWELEGEHAVVLNYQV